MPLHLTRQQINSLSAEIGDLALRSISEELLLLPDAAFAPTASSGICPAPLMLFGVLAATGDLPKTMLLCFVGDENFAAMALFLSAAADDGEGAAAPIEALFFFRSFFFRTMA